jgi:hypothetical protein
MPRKNLDITINDPTCLMTLSTNPSYTYGLNNIMGLKLKGSVYTLTIPPIAYDFDPGDIAITEVVHKNGTPNLVHSIPSPSGGPYYYGFLSGTEAYFDSYKYSQLSGCGTPLKGYETARGTGIKLGDYWE